MKHTIKSITGFTIGATDGEIGTVKEFYFDDKTWTIRYVIVETGSWLFGRRVLISPQSIQQPDWDKKVFQVNLTKDQIKHSPNIDAEQTVSKQQEIELFKHYQWDNYWGPGSLWAGGVGTTGMFMPGPGLVPADNIIEDKVSDNTESHLRSTKEVTGYNIKATDGNIGDVEDFMINDKNWKIDYLIIDTGKWLSGRKVIISPNLIKDLQWGTSEVIVNATIEHVKNSPEYDTDKEFSDSDENNLQEYYNGFITEKR